MGFCFRSTVFLLSVALVFAQRTTKKPNIPDFEDRYVSNPFTAEELASLGGVGSPGGTVGVVPPSDIQGGGGSSGGVFNPPANPPTPSSTSTTTEDFSSIFLGNQQQQPQPQQPDNNSNNNINGQMTNNNNNEASQQVGRPDRLPPRPGNNRPIWNRPFRGQTRPWGNRRMFD